ncbi:hypothetical protein C7212DRAFT_348176 [Tuber magnatum]|uniref:Uncharacterized protein n=1 Tax=Tuber magnatum TaxID=42249 RepID=A0A317SGY7_9PEZI|nr:hypothetical protein C7212DRAFT_348176 [Tuber magnatum]
MASNTCAPIMENSAFLGSGILRHKDRAHDRTYLLAGFDRDERKLIKRIVVKHHGDNLAAQNETWTNLMPECKRKVINDLHKELVSLETYQEGIHEVVGDSSDGSSEGPGRRAGEKLEHGTSGGGGYGEAMLEHAALSKNSANLRSRAKPLSGWASVGVGGGTWECLEERCVISERVRADGHPLTGAVAKVRRAEMLVEAVYGECLKVRYMISELERVSANWTEFLARGAVEVRPAEVLVEGVYGVYLKVRCVISESEQRLGQQRCRGRQRLLITTMGGHLSGY